MHVNAKAKAEKDTSALHGGENWNKTLRFITIVLVLLTAINICNTYLSEKIKSPKQMLDRNLNTQASTSTIRDKGIVAVGNMITVSDETEPTETNNTIQNTLPSTDNQKNTTASNCEQQRMSIPISPTSDTAANVLANDKYGSDLQRVGTTQEYTSMNQNTTNKEYPSWYSYLLTTSSIMHGICVAAYAVFISKQENCIRGIPSSLLLNSVPDKKTLGSIRIYTLVFVMLVAINAWSNARSLVALCWSVTAIFTISMLALQNKIENKLLTEEMAVEYIKKVLIEDLEATSSKDSEESHSWQQLMVCMYRNSLNSNQIVSPTSISDTQFLLKCLHQGATFVFHNDTVCIEQLCTLNNEQFNKYQKMVYYVLFQVMSLTSRKGRKRFLNQLIEYLDGIKTQDSLASVCFSYLSQLFVMLFFIKDEDKNNLKLICNKFVHPKTVNNGAYTPMFNWTAAYGFCIGNIEPDGTCLEKEISRYIDFFDTVSNEHLNIPFYICEGKRYEYTKQDKCPLGLIFESSQIMFEELYS